MMSHLDLPHRYIRWRRANIHPSFRDDATSAALIGLWRAAEMYKTDSELPFWKYAITWMRTYINREVQRLYRYYKIHRKSRSVSKDSEVLEAAMAGECREAFEKMLRKMPPHYAEVVKLRLIEEMTFQSIADQLGITKNGAHLLWKRAHEKLEILLAMGDLRKFLI